MRSFIGELLEDDDIFKFIMEEGLIVLSIINQNEYLGQSNLLYKIEVGNLEDMYEFVEYVENFIRRHSILINRMRTKTVYNKILLPLYNELVKPEVDTDTILLRRCRIYSPKNLDFETFNLFSNSFVDTIIEINNLGLDILKDDCSWVNN